LLIDSLKELSRNSIEIGFNIKGSVINLDKGFDSKANRRKIQNRKMIPNIAENKRNRKKPKRGRKRFFDKEVFKERFKSERTFSWEDKFRRVVICYEKLQEHHMGFKFLAYSLINIRKLINSQ